MTKATRIQPLGRSILSRSVHSAVCPMPIVLLFKSRARPGLHALPHHRQDSGTSSCVMFKFLKKTPEANGEVDSAVVLDTIDDQAHIKAEPVGNLRRLSSPNSVGDTTTEEKANAIAGIDKEQEEELVYPTGLKIVGIIFGLCCAVFLVALDQTIIATASKYTNVISCLLN